MFGCLSVSTFLTMFGFLYSMPTPYPNVDVFLIPTQTLTLHVGLFLSPPHVDVILTLLGLCYLMPAPPFVWLPFPPGLGSDSSLQITPLHECPSCPDFYLVRWAPPLYKCSPHYAWAVKLHIVSPSICGHSPHLVKAPTSHTRLPFHEKAPLTLFRLSYPIPGILPMWKLSSSCCPSWFQTPHIKLSPSIAWLPASHHLSFYNLSWSTTAPPSLIPLLNPTLFAPPHWL